MPELPEVETTCRGIRDLVVGHSIAEITVRNAALRWPVQNNLQSILQGKTIQSVTRRAKYILLNFAHGKLIIHLGMTGHLSVLDTSTPPTKHDHIDMTFTSRRLVRYNDVRRFGSIHWEAVGQTHFLLKTLGVEPLDDAFNATYLHTICRQRKTPIKTLLMNHKLVVGIGNIYASEALFLAKVHPRRPAHTITKKEATAIVQYSRTCLQSAIECGGTTLKDFKKADGKPGYFQNKLYVYGRQNQSCLVCQTPIEKYTQAQRATFFCPCCQGTMPT